MPSNVAKDTIVGGGGPAPVVFGRQAVDRDHNSDPAGTTPLKGDWSDRAGHDLGMHLPPSQLWKEASYFPPADQRFAAYDRQV